MTQKFLRTLIEKTLYDKITWYPGIRKVNKKFVMTSVMTMYKKKPIVITYSRKNSILKKDLFEIARLRIIKSLS